MRVAIAGAGNVGTYIAADLKAAGHEVLLIEQNPDLVARLRPTLDVEWYIADACEVQSLYNVGLETCDVVVAATGDDEDNLVTSLLAKQEFAVPRVLARVNHSNNEWMFTEQWGVDAAVSPPHILTALVEEAVTVGDLVRLLKLERGRVTLFELTLGTDSKAAGRPMYELRLPRDSAIVAIIREEHVIIPQPETVLAVGDEVIAIARPEVEEELRRALE